MWGGSSGNVVILARSAERNRVNPLFRNDFIGFQPTSRGPLESGHYKQIEEALD
jgi:hypothetical protein